jgi:signal transduction histidine kinase
LGENELSMLMIVYVVCFVPVIIIPGRIARGDAHLRLLSQKQAFVRYVSHEIRSPLSIVSAGLEIFVARLNEEGAAPSPSTSENAGPNATPELLELANELSESNDTAINIINDLLQYESMDAGMFKLEAAPVDPVELFKAKALAIIAKRHSLTLKVVPPAVEDGVCVLVDVYRIEQVKN